MTFTITAAAPAATLTSLSPSSAAAGGGAFTLTVNGTGFVNGATVQWNGQARTTTFAGSSQLTAAIAGSDIGAAGTSQVTVVNPGAGASNALTFTITPPPASFTLNVSKSGPGTGDQQPRWYQLRSRLFGVLCGRKRRDTHGNAEQKCHIPVERRGLWNRSTYGDDGRRPVGDSDIPKQIGMTAVGKVREQGSALERVGLPC